MPPGTSPPANTPCITQKDGGRVWWVCFLASTTCRPSHTYFALWVVETGTGSPSFCHTHTLHLCTCLFSTLSLSAHMPFIIIKKTGDRHYTLHAAFAFLYHAHTHTHTDHTHTPPFPSTTFLVSVGGDRMEQEEGAGTVAGGLLRARLLPFGLYYLYHSFLLLLLLFLYGRLSYASVLSELPFSLVVVHTYSLL